MTPEKAKAMNVERALENGDKMAFPLSTNMGHNHGLTKREYIATQLLSGAITRSSPDNEIVVNEVIRVTDLLLIALHINS
jgi:hypothetical protein